MKRYQIQEKHLYPELISFRRWTAYLVTNDSFACSIQHNVKRFIMTKTWRGQPAGNVIWQTLLWLYANHLCAPQSLSLSSLWNVYFWTVFAGCTKKKRFWASVYLSGSRGRISIFDAFEINNKAIFWDLTVYKTVVIVLENWITFIINSWTISIARHQKSVCLCPAYLRTYRPCDRWL